MTLHVRTIERIRHTPGELIASLLPPNEATYVRALRTRVLMREATSSVRTFW